jgi:hypothetical protein
MLDQQWQYHQRYEVRLAKKLSLVVVVVLLLLLHLG